MTIYSGEALCGFSSTPNSRLCRHLGNKCDLDQEREVMFEDACNLAKNRGMLVALETSAKVFSVRPSQERETINQSWCLTFCSVVSTGE